MSIAKPTRRREDGRFLTGRGTYADDIDLPGQAHAAFVRSPYAHGVIRGIDLEAARAAPGVLGLYTAADLQAAGIGPIPYLPMPKFPLVTQIDAPRPVLATNRVRHVGEPVVLVVAESLAEAQDAAELVGLDIDPLPAVTDTAAAVQPDAPAVWDEAPGNVGLTWHGGDKAAADAAFSRAAHITRVRLINNRVVANPIE